jgi:pSer/pThr/pTyr-binding forkhead associated (FHA) protein
MTTNPKLNLDRIDDIDLEQGKSILIIETPSYRKAITLNTSLFSIGRQANNSLVINDKLISRHHATIAWLKEQNERIEDSKSAYWIIDGKGAENRSRNGIWINGTRKVLHKLVSGDIIGLGTDLQLTYRYIPQNTERDRLLKTVYYL